MMILDKTAKQTTNDRQKPLNVKGCGAERRTPLGLRGSASILDSFHSHLRALAVMVVMMLFGGAAWGQQALPYSYGFENNSLATDGWSAITTSSSSGIYNAGTGTAHGGSYLFRFHYSERSAYLISPRLTNTASGVHLSFWYKNSSTSYTEQFQVGYTTANNTDPTTYTYGSTIYGENNWTQHELDLPANTQYVAIKYIYTDGLYLYLDDFEFSAPSSCPKPIDLFASNTTNNSATINWTAVGSESQWDIYYSTSSTEPTGSTTPSVTATSTKPYTITGLTCGTTYYAWVRANCGSETSSWSPVASFTPASLFEDFEGVTGTAYSTAGSMPAGWYAYTTSTGNNIVTPHVCSGGSYNFYHSASQSVNMESGTNANNTAYVVLPQIANVSSATISFYYRQENVSYGSLVFGYVTAQNATACGNFQALETMAATTTLTQVNLNMADYTIPNNNVYLAFKWTVTNGTYYACCIDDVLICESSSCPTTISNLQDWNDFCDCVNDGHDYAGETVTLMNDVAGVARMAGTGNNASSPFRGTFDGQGHTLTVAIIGNSTQGQAPFQYIQGATIKNLVVSGSVTASYGSYPHAAGLVGFAWSGTNTIQNCLIHTNVTNNTGTSQNSHIGGIVGHAKASTIVMEGCVYDGRLTGDHYKGGLIGWSDGGATINLTNCLFNGTVSNTTTGFHPIGCSVSGGNVHGFVNNSYYAATNEVEARLDDLAKAIVNGTTGKGKHAYTVTGDGCVTVDLEPPATTYNVSGIVAYSPGIKYVGANGTIYGGDGDNMNLVLGCSNGGVESYSADHGTLSGSELDGTNDPYTLTMDANNTVISAVESSCPITEITSVTDWNKFCTCVSTGSDYSGLTVNLRADISVTTMAGDGSHLFRGTFDGHEHTITVTYTATDDGGTAPFRATNGATFQNLHVTGTINMGNHTTGAGLVASSYGNTTITNCKSSVTISSTVSGDGSNGGFIAINKGQYPSGNTTGTATFTGCVFSGSLLGSTTSNCGGFVGYTHYATYSGNVIRWAQVVLNNCLFIPTEITMSTTSSATFTRSPDNNTTRYTASNTYYTESFGTAQGKQAYTVEGIDGVTAARTGTPTDYSVSGISAYTIGLVYNGTIYGGNGDVLSLALSYSGGAHDGYIADYGTLSGSETDGTNDPYDLTMVAHDTKIRVQCPNSIHNRAEWDAFCNCVNNGHDYYNETVTLDANLTGGQTVSTMAGTTDLTYSFRGTFDGQAHTLDVSISSSEQGAAPFRCIDGATIKDLKVTGTVTSTAHHASGLVGFCKDGGTNTIRNCLVSTNVTNNNTYNGDAGNNYLGGIVGHNLSSTTSIIGCVYDGTITSQGFKGGMVGFGNYNSNVTITDSYFNGAYSTNGYANPNFSPIACHGSGRNFNFTFSNFYYNTDAGTFTAPAYEGTVNANYSGTGRAKHAYSVTGIDNVTVNRTNETATYNVSGITAYGTGIKYNSVFYGGDGDVLALLLSHAGDFCGYRADHGTLSGSATTGTNDAYDLTMEAYNTQIGVAPCPTAPICFDFNTDSYSTAPDVDSGLPAGWNRVYSGTTTGGTPHIISNGGFDCGTRGIFMAAFNGVTFGPTSIVILPRVTGISAGTEITFKARFQTTGRLRLGYMNGSTFTPFPTMTITNGSTTSCTDYSYTLTAAEATEIENNGRRLAFEWYHNDESNIHSARFVFLDDICIQPPCDTTIVGDHSGTATNTYLPSYNFFNYSLTQQIYKPCEIGKKGTLTSIAFYNGGTTKTRTYDIYLKSTIKDAFDNTSDWISVTDADRVYRGSVTMTAGAWTVIEFNNTFVYDGNSNLAVIIDDNTGSYTSSPHMACRVYSTTEYQAIYTYQDGSDINPSGTSVTGTQTYNKNQIKFNVCSPVDIPTSTYTVTVSANPAAGGTVTSVDRCNKFTVTATPNDCYKFVNWTEGGSEVSTDATYSFTATSNRTLVANFETKPVEIITDPASLDCFEPGTEVVLTASVEDENYSFSTGVDGSKWYNVTNTTSLITTAGDGVASTLQDIGFNFPFGGTLYTQFSVNSDGNLRLGPTVTGTGNYSSPFSSSNANSNNPKINGMGFDGYFDISTYINYVRKQVFGTAPNRVLVVEFHESPFSSSYRQYTWKWQVQLFEDGTIQLVYGPTAPGSYNYVNQIGLCVNASDGWTVSTTTHEATHFTNGTSTTNTEANSWPGNSRYYRFTPNTCTWAYTGTAGTATGNIYTVSPTVNSTYTAVVTTGGCSYTGSIEINISNYAIEAVANPAAGGTVTKTKNNGCNYTMTATPNDCYRFVNWTEGGTEVSTDATYSFTATGNRTLVANFEEYSVSITSDPDPLTCLASGTEVVLTASTDIPAAGGTYAFTNTTSSFSSISGSPDGTSSNTGDGATYAFSLPFDFILAGKSFASGTTLTMRCDGFVTFGSTWSTNTPSGPGSTYSVISPLGYDQNLISGESYMYYKVTGSVGSRVLTMEWKNMRSWYGTSSQYNWTNYQVKLYECSNMIELCYGSFTHNYTSTSVYIYLTADGKITNLTSITSPNISTNSTGTTSSISIGSAAAAPANGTVYRFTPPAPYTWTYTGTAGTANCATYTALPTQNSSYTVSVSGVGCTKSASVDVFLQLEATIEFGD